MTVKDRVALVTGGSRGIGRAIVEALARNGAKVAFVYNSNAAAAEEVVKALAAEGHEAWAIQADVRSKPAADQVVADVVAKWGKLEILVNNAGIIRDTLLAKMDSTQWQDVIDTNLTGVFQVCRAAAARMSDGGRIVNMASISGVVGFYGQVNYSAAKAGVIAITKVLSKELARRNITVNAVAPGVVLTEMGQTIPEEVRQGMLNQIPLGRFGEPREISDVIVFLCSDLASYLTGQTLHANGGWVAG